VRSVQLLTLQGKMVRQKHPGLGMASYFEAPFGFTNEISKKEDDMVTILIPLLMVVAGVLLCALSSQATIKEFGRGMMWAGLFAIAFAFTGKSVHLL
jgi:hypothetical protein